MISTFHTLTTRKDADFIASELLGDSDWDGRSEDESNLSDWLWSSFNGRQYEEFKRELPDGDSFFEFI